VDRQSIVGLQLQPKFLILHGTCYIDIRYIKHTTGSIHR